MFRNWVNSEVIILWQAVVAPGIIICKDHIFLNKFLVGVGSQELLTQLGGAWKQLYIGGCRELIWSDGLKHLISGAQEKLWWWRMLLLLWTCAKLVMNKKGIKVNARRCWTLSLRIILDVKGLDWRNFSLWFCSKLRWLIWVVPSVRGVGRV